MSKGRWASLVGGTLFVAFMLVQAWIAVEANRTRTALDIECVRAGGSLIQSQWLPAHCVHGSPVKPSS